MFETPYHRVGRISSYLSNYRRTLKHINAVPIRSRYIAPSAPGKRTTATTAEMGQGKADAQHPNKTTRSCTPEAQDSTPSTQSISDTPMTPRRPSDPAVCADCTPALADATRETLSTCLAAYTGRRLEEQKADIIERLMRIFETWLDVQLDRFEEVYDDGGDDVRRERGKSGGMRPARNETGRGGRAGQKRSYDRDDGDENSSEDNGTGDGKEGRRTATKRTKLQHFHLACPYHKRDPERHRKCIGQGPGWPDFNRVKEHVLRSHGLPVYCPRCQKGFKLQTEVNQHLRQADLCSVVEATGPHDPIEGFDTAQRESLKGRRVGVSEEEKWADMYRLLFKLGDDEKTPSPYFDDVSPSKAQRVVAVVREEIPKLVREALGKLLSIESREVEVRVTTRFALIIEEILGCKTKAKSLSRRGTGAETETGLGAGLELEGATCSSLPGFPADGQLQVAEAWRILADTLTVNPSALMDIPETYAGFSDTTSPELPSSSSSSLGSGSSSSASSGGTSLTSSTRSSRESTPPVESFSLLDERYYMPTKPEYWFGPPGDQIRGGIED